MSDDDGMNDFEARTMRTPVQWWQADAGAAGASDPGDDGDAGDGDDFGPGAEPEAAPEKAPKARTALDLVKSGEVEDKPAAAPSTWPEDWRARMSGGDEKVAKRLERFASPDKVFESYRQLEAKVRSGELRKPLAEDATPEEVAAWRKEQGIPESFEGYYDGMKDIAIGEADKPLFDDFFQNFVHKNNLPPGVAKDAARWYYDLQQSRQEHQHEVDATQMKEAEDELREEWGGEYRANMTMINNLLSRVPEELAEKVGSARLPDGSALFNDPQWLRFMAGIEREINPASALTTPGARSDLGGIQDQIDEIEKVMKTNRAAYRADEKMQGRLRDLYDARDKLKARGAE